MEKAGHGGLELLLCDFQVKDEMRRCSTECHYILYIGRTLRLCQWSLFVESNSAVVFLLTSRQLEVQVDMVGHA
jgi:hypothetical protein